MRGVGELSEAEDKPDPENLEDLYGFWLLGFSGRYGPSGWKGVGDKMQDMLPQSLRVGL